MVQVDNSTFKEAYQSHYICLQNIYVINNTKWLHTSLVGPHTSHQTKHLWVFFKDTCSLAARVCEGG